VWQQPAPIEVLQRLGDDFGEVLAPHTITSAQWLGTLEGGG
jgi:hypothetical protein